MKKIDNILIKFLLIVFLLTIFIYFIKPIYLAFLIALLVYALIGIFLNIFNNHKRKLKVSYLREYLALRGHLFCLDIVLKTLNSNINGNIVDEQIIIEGLNGKELLYVSVKFGISSYDDIAKAIRLAEKHNISKINFLCSHLERKSLNLLNSTSISFKLLSFRGFTKSVEKKNLVEIKKGKIKGKGIKNFIRVIISSLNKKNAIRFLFTGIITLLLTFLSPIKLYYIIAGSIQIFIAFICFLRPFDGEKNNYF